MLSSDKFGGVQYFLVLFLCSSSNLARFPWLSSQVSWESKIENERLRHLSVVL